MSYWQEISAETINGEHYDPLIRWAGGKWITPTEAVEAWKQLLAILFQDGTIDNRLIMKKRNSLPNPPDNWRHPLGPYRQAPAEYGGEWWFVNPFTGGEPWIRAGLKPTPEVLPDGFVEIFGPFPQFIDFPNSPAWTTARNHWRQNLEQFKGAGRPLWLSAAQVEELDPIYQAWGMGKPRFYGGRYGEMTRWPQSAMPDFEQSAHFAANYPHHAIAIYQAKMIGMGVAVGDRHPFFPPEWEGPATEDAE